MIFALIFFGIWLAVTAIVFAVLYDEDEWVWALWFSAIWPIACGIALIASISGSFAEARRLWRSNDE